MMAFEYVPGDTVEVPEIPYKDEITLVAAETALVVEDIQNDFVDPKGALFIPSAVATLPRIEKFVKRARAHGVHIAYTQDTHIEGDLEWGTFPEHCARGSWGWQIIDSLRPQPGEVVVQKVRYDGFYATTLDHFLSHVWRVKNVIIVGTVSNICVLHTAASAGQRWFRVILAAESISAMTDFDQAMTLRQVSWLYPNDVVRSLEDIHFA
jgi:nicotinamidase-related amidase